MTKTVYTLCIVAITTTNLFGQSLKKERLDYEWKNMKNMVVESVKQMPQEHWDLVPAEGLRSFREQVKHITTSNRFFASSLIGANADIKVANDQTGTLTGKDEIIVDLGKSFDYVNSVIAGIDDYSTEVNFFGQVLSRTELLMQTEHHLHREHGKITIYMRMKGIAPAKSTSWLK